MEKIFGILKKEYAGNEEKREKAIIDSRPVLRLAKQAIYDMHKGKTDEAEKKLKEAHNLLHSIEPEHSTWNAAAQEYAEAACFLNYLKKGKLPAPDKLGIGAEDYLLGLSDLTGELARRAVLSAVKEDYSEVQHTYAFVEEIFRNMLDFDLRNSELRKKSDSIKWNLKKIEEVLYDLKMRGKG